MSKELGAEMTDGIELKSAAHSSDLDSDFYCNPESLETIEIELPDPGRQKISDILKEVRKKQNERFT